MADVQRIPHQFRIEPTLFGWKKDCWLSNSEQPTDNHNQSFTALNLPLADTWDFLPSKSAYFNLNAQSILLKFIGRTLTSYSANKASRNICIALRFRTKTSSSRSSLSFAQSKNHFPSVLPHDEKLMYLIVRGFLSVALMIDSACPVMRTSIRPLTVMLMVSGSGLIGDKIFFTRIVRSGCVCRWRRISTNVLLPAPITAHDEHIRLISPKMCDHWPYSIYQFHRPPLFSPADRSVRAERVHL